METDKFKLVIKRIGAYLIDSLLIALLLMIISQSNIIKSEIKLYENDKKIYEKYSDQFEDEKISFTEYSNKVKDLSVVMQKHNLYNTGALVILYVGYYVIFQCLNKGQTLGKKVMKIKVFSNNDKKLNWLNYFIRSGLLLGLFTSIINAILVYVLKPSAFYYTSTIISLLGSLILYIIVFSTLIRKDGRGLHDILSNTKVDYIAPIKKVAEDRIEEKEIKKEKTITHKMTKKSVNKKAKKK